MPTYPYDLDKSSLKSSFFLVSIVSHYSTRTTSITHSSSSFIPPMISFVLFAGLPIVLLPSRSSDLSMDLRPNPRLPFHLMLYPELIS